MVAHRVGQQLARSGAHHRHRGIGRQRLGQVAGARGVVVGQKHLHRPGAARRCQALSPNGHPPVIAPSRHRRYYRAMTRLSPSLRHGARSARWPPHPIRRRDAICCASCAPQGRVASVLLLTPFACIVQAGQPAGHRLARKGGLRRHLLEHAGSVDRPARPHRRHTGAAARAAAGRPRADLRLQPLELAGHPGPRRHAARLLRGQG